MADVVQLGATQVITAPASSASSNALVIGAANTVRVSSTLDVYFSFTASSGTAAATDPILSEETVQYFHVPTGHFLNVKRVGGTDAIVSVTSVDLR